MKMKALLAGLAGLAVAGSAQAAVITYTLTLNDDGTGALALGKFAVRATSSAADNAGIAAFTYGVSGLNAADLANLVNKAPTVTYRNAAFNLFRGTGFSLNVAGDGVAQQTGSQDTTASYLPPLVYNIGQTSGTVASVGAPSGTPINASGDPGAYSVPVLLATGTFGATDIPTVGAGSATTGGNVFNLAKDRTTFAATATYSNLNLNTGGTPEPASLAVLGLAGIGTLARRRKTA